MFWDPSTCESNDLHVLGPVPTCRYTSLDRGCTQEKSEEMPVQLARLVLLATKKDKLPIGSMRLLCLPTFEFG